MKSHCLRVYLALTFHKTAFLTNYLPSFADFLHNVDGFLSHRYPVLFQSPTASLGPRNTYSLRVSRLVRLLLGAPFPVPSFSCFFLYYESVGTAAGTVLQGSCHWFVNGESAGLSFSSFDSPLVGSVLSRCWCFTLRCLFSLALRYWLTLLPHSPLFHIQIASKFPTSPQNRHNMQRLEVCISTVSYLCQSQPT